MQNMQLCPKCTVPNNLECDDGFLDPRITTKNKKEFDFASNMGFDPPLIFYNKKTSNFLLPNSTFNFFC